MIFVSVFRYLSAGESHGPQLTAIIEGLPSGLPVRFEAINSDLARRQQGYGRGGRMKIETDTVEILSGVRWGETLGSPLTLTVKNRDWENWNTKMSAQPDDRDDTIAVTRPRPGHADLTGALKYHHADVRNILERSSARETAVRVAVGAVAKQLLGEFGIRIGGFVTAVGGVQATPAVLPYEELWQVAAGSEMFCCDRSAEEQMKRAIDDARSNGDTLGGVVEVQVLGCPPGLGSHVHWDRKLDARLAMALMSIQAIKGVEVGLGFGVADRPGSRVHDEISYDAAQTDAGMKTAYHRMSNNCRRHRGRHVQWRADHAAGSHETDPDPVQAAALGGYEDPRTVRGRGGAFRHLRGTGSSGGRRSGRRDRNRISFP